MLCCKRRSHVHPDGESQHHKTAADKIPAILSCYDLKKIFERPPCTISVLETDVGKQSEADFKADHIPTAVFFDQLECTTPTTYIPRGLPDVKCFEDYLTRLGVSNTDHIVLYDRSPTGFLASSRAWVVLKAYGINRLSILNGGFQRWKKENNNTEPSESDSLNNQDKKFTVKMNKQMVRDYDQMIANFSSSTGRVQVIDARPPDLFNSAEAGHMPGALNLPYSSVLDQTNQCLKSNEQLKEIFTKAGVDLSKPAIYSCNTGTTASTLAFVAHQLGQKEVSVYIGAFTEWQQRAPADMIIKGGENAAVA